VFVIADTGSAHRGNASINRLQGAWKNLILVHTPVHASWLNQAEIYFSVVQRKVLTPNDFADLDTLEERLLAFGRPLRADRRPLPMEVHPYRPPTASPTSSTDPPPKPPDPRIRRRTSKPEH
jgi:DDE superfamily endonuclease